jgi:hypothetical protein
MSPTATMVTEDFACAGWIVDAINATKVTVTTGTR